MTSTRKLSCRWWIVFVSVLCTPAALNTFTTFNRAISELTRNSARLTDQRGSYALHLAVARLYYLYPSSFAVLPTSDIKHVAYLTLSSNNDLKRHSLSVTDISVPQTVLSISDAVRDRVAFQPFG